MKRIKLFLSCGTCKQAKKDSGGTVDDWIKHYIEFVSKTQEDKNNSVIDELRKHQMLKQNFVRKPSMFGTLMCWDCFAKLHAMSLSTMKTMKKAAKGKDQHWQHQGRNESIHPAPKKKAVMSFIENLQTLLGKQ
jgi:Fic family protein